MNHTIRFTLVGLVILAIVGTLTHFDLGKTLDTEVDIAPFGTVDIVRFRGHPRNIIIYFSDAKGWRKELESEAWGEAWPDRIVAGVDLPQFRKAFAGQSCADYAGAVRDIDAAVAAALNISPDEAPFLVGAREGAAVAYAAAAQSTPDKIQGVVTRDFCPLLRETVPPCAGENDLQTTSRADGFLMHASPAVATPFVAVTDPGTCKAADVPAFMAQLPDAHIIKPIPNMIDLMAAVVTQTNERTSSDPAVTASDLDDLPLVEVPAAAGTADDRLAVVLTGDGGWADIDRTIGEALAKDGVAVVGFNTLKYFWTEKKPEEAATDLARVVRHYAAQWHKHRVLLIGYSFGADVLPFLYAKLPDAVKRETSLVALLAPSAHTAFEISVGGWVGVENVDGAAVAPAIAALDAPTLCFQNTEDDTRPCDGIAKPNIETVNMQGDHHFNGAYAPIVAHMLAKTQK